MGGESSPQVPSAGGLTLLIAPARPAAPVAALALDEQISEFPPLVGPEGSSCSLDSYASARVLVVAFLGDACPAVKAGISELVELQRRYLERGVQIVGVNSNNPYLSPTDTPDAMVLWANEHALNFPYLKDPGGELAHRLGALNTPHFLVFDSARRLRYRGRMFDSRDPARASRRDLELIVQALVERREFPSEETTPLGCSIVW